MICADKSFFRDVKDNPPPSLRRAAGFSLCAAFSGAHKKMNAAHSLFPRKPRYWQIRLRCGKARFSLRERIAFTKKRRAVGAFFREFEGKPERASQQGDDVHAARNTCRIAYMRLLLLIPKNLTPLRALRFLEALFPPRDIAGHAKYAIARLHPFRKPRYRQIG